MLPPNPPMPTRPAACLTYSESWPKLYSRVYEQFPSAGAWFHHYIGRREYVTRLLTCFNRYEVARYPNDVINRMVIEGLAVANLYTSVGDVGHPYLDLQIRAGDTHPLNPQIEVLELDLLDTNPEPGAPGRFLALRFVRQGEYFYEVSDAE